MSSPSSAETRFLLNQLLREVSRSFFLTLKFLPDQIRPQIGLAYLLARATDTIADTEVIPLDDRLNALHSLRDALCSHRSIPEFGNLAKNQTLAAEKILLQRIPSAIKLLRTLAADDQQRIGQVLEIITSGQELDLVRFRARTADQPVALETEADLEDYTWRVAGCVGEFWTEMCLAHLRPQPEMERSKLIEQGIRFGKGLQLVNILRDIPADLRRGRCYLPGSDLQTRRHSPADLLDLNNFHSIRPIYIKWVGRAEEHLQAGWEYTKALPRKWFRVKLACAWPILIGSATLQKLRIANVLDPQQRVKIGRAEVRNIILKTVVLYPFKSKWNGLGPSPD